MKKNNFMKSLLALMMMLAVSMSMTSCQGLVDAVFGSEDNSTETPEKPEKKTAEVTLTKDGAKIIASTAEEVSELLATLVDDIIENGVKEDKEYVIEISLPSSEKAGATQEIEVPEIEGATLNLVFTEKFAKPGTLTLKSQSISATRGTRGDDEDAPIVIVTFDEAISETNIQTLDIQMPSSFVMIKTNASKAVFNLAIRPENGWNGGYWSYDEGDFDGLVINDNIEINTILYRQDSSKGGLEVRTYRLAWRNGETFMPVNNWNTENPAKSIYIEKGKSDAQLSFTSRYFEKMTIADGGVLSATALRANYIEGEGTATIKVEEVAEKSKEKENYYKYGFKLGFTQVDDENNELCIEKVSNVIFSIYNDTEYSEFTVNENSVLQAVTIEGLPEDMTDCEFIVDGKPYEFNYNSEHGTWYYYNNDKD